VRIIESIALISINATMVFQLLSFLLFLVLLHRIMLRPLMRIMEERERLLTRIKDDIDDAREEHLEIQQQIEADDALARETAHKIREDIEASAKQTAAEIVDQTRVEIDRLKTKAQEEAALRLAAAREEMKAEAEAIGERMAARLLELKT
jgi:F-type H+-transporting ATPase subunit b